MVIDHSDLLLIPAKLWSLVHPDYVPEILFIWSGFYYDSKSIFKIIVMILKFNSPCYSRRMFSLIWIHMYDLDFSYHSSPCFRSRVLMSLLIHLLIIYHYDFLRFQPLLWSWSLAYPAYVPNFHLIMALTLSFNSCYDLTLSFNSRSSCLSPHGVLIDLNACTYNLDAFT